MEEKLRGYRPEALAAIHVEATVTPAHHIFDDKIGDHFLFFEQGKDLPAKCILQILCNGFRFNDEKMISKRPDGISSFIVMDVLQKAHDIKRRGIDVIHSANSMENIEEGMNRIAEYLVPGKKAFLKQRAH